MLALLILPILISGFIVLSINPFEKLKLHRYDGQLLYLKAAKIGFRYFTLITIISFLMKDVSFRVPVLSTEVTGDYFKIIYIDPAIVTRITHVIFRITGTENLTMSWVMSLSFLTVFSAYVVSILKNKWIKIQNRISKYIYKNEIPSIVLLGRILKDSPIDYMFYESFVNRIPILLSLKNRKVYIGFVNKLGEPSESEEPNQEISLVPAISGYRDKDTLKVILQNEYSIPSHLDSSIVIKVDQIETVSWFTQEIYEGVNDNINEISTSTSHESLDKPFGGKTKDIFKYLFLRMRM